MKRPKKIDHDKRSDCPLSSWLDLFGDKWTLLILRDIAFFGKRHFKDFVNSEERIATNILANRLKKLEELAIITKSSSDQNKLNKVYALTPRALEMAPIFMEIAKWSNKHIKDVQSIEFPDHLVNH